MLLGQLLLEEAHLKILGYARECEHLRLSFTEEDLEDLLPWLHPEGLHEIVEDLVKEGYLRRER